MFQNAPQITRNFSDYVVNNMISRSKCVEDCMNFHMQQDYAFVWVFIVGFLFTQISARMLHWKFLNITPKQRYNLIEGFKIAGYFLNVFGIIYFIYFVLP